MSSTFIPQPKEYWIDNKRTMSFVQFVPGVTVSVVTGEDTLSFAGNKRKLGSIIAMPHYSNDGGIRKASMLGEESRHYALLRGMQEAPLPGDPVLLCELGGIKYYIGPLNTEGNVNYNRDEFSAMQSRPRGKSQKIMENSKGDGLSNLPPMFSRLPFLRLHKFKNKELKNCVKLY